MLGNSKMGKNMVKEEKFSSTGGIMMGNTNTVNQMVMAFSPHLMEL
jgi:hypothetical protein